MNLQFDTDLSQGYNSPTQKVRVMSECWLHDNMYCPNCGNPRINHLKNNSPAADFQCDYCGIIFELKSQKGKLGKKVADGAYSTMVERITSDTNPDLFLLQYNEQFNVTDLLVIPRFFFIPEIIERRHPLAPTARRSGWVGCNILYAEIPTQGRIPAIRERMVLPRQEVVENYRLSKSLKTDSLEARGWLMDVLSCVNALNKAEFSLSEVYAHIEEFRRKHINNKNIEAKIRQQLQVLRDKGFIEFLGKGQYRKRDKCSLGY